MTSAPIPRSDLVWSGFLSPGYEATEIQESEAVLAPIYEHVFGRKLTDFSSTALTDARFYGLDFGVPAFCFGARMEGAHGFNERVDLASVKRVTKALALFVASWCGIEAD